jgi:hypothetical protein
MKFEKRRRTSGAGGDRGGEVGQDADHVKPQFLAVNHKHSIKNMSRRERAMVGKKLTDCKGEWDNTNDNYEIEVEPSKLFQRGYK